MRNFLVSFLLCSVFTSAAVAQTGDQQSSSGVPGSENGGEPTLARLAREADFIGLVQVDDTEYDTVRDIPSEGFASLRVLVTYRHPGEIREAPGSVKVHEKGFDEDSCYYPERRNEGRRYLVFLQQRTGKTPDGEKRDGYEGSRPGCMIHVLVTSRNQYALRYPVDGVNVGESDPVREIAYADPDAFVEPGDDLSYSRADYMAEQGWLKRADNDHFVYTRGIYLEDARDMMELREEIGGTADE